jgi:acetyl esterase/lipase
MGGHKSDFDLLGSALAARGLVVFATDYRTNGTLDDVSVDVACGYRLARRLAGRYGGDLTRPVTGVGYSFGASLMLSGALHRVPTGAGARCAQGLPLPDVVVGLNGCYYVWAGRPQPFSTDDLDRREADVVLLAGSADRDCPAWESRKAAAALEAAGFRTTLTTIEGANHHTPLFHDFVGEKWVSVPGGAAGEQTVDAILDAVRARS